MRVFADVDELRAAEGSHLGTSEWMTVDQFASTCSPTPPTTTSGSTSTRRRRRTARSATTIAHGFLTLSLLPKLGWEIYKVENVKMTINYGLNKVRFTSPSRSAAGSAAASSWPTSPTSTAGCRCSTR